MARLVADLLDFTRTRVGQGIPLRTAWTDLAEVVGTTADEASTGTAQGRVRCAINLRSRVCCDPDRVAQVVSNLVANALRHGATDAPVDVRLGEERDDAVLRVHNEGPPIPRELLPHLFEPFRRAAGDPVSGVGLGLFIARAVVLAHGGTMEVTSEPGRGTTFTVRLPKEGPRQRGETAWAGEDPHRAAG
jgi:signal transduction histidine kinase